MDIYLSKREDKLICLLYKQYLERLKYGDPERDARYAGSTKMIKQNLAPDMSLYDIDVAMHDLGKKGLVLDYETEAGLTDDGIVYIRGRFGTDVVAIVKYLEEKQK